MKVLPFVVLVAAAALFAYRMRHGRRPLLITTAGRARAWLATRNAASGRDPVLGVAGLVAGREVRERLRGRAFRVATLLVLAGVAAAIVIPALTSGSATTQRIGVVGTLSQDARNRIAAVGRAVGSSVRLVTEPDLAAARRDLDAKQLDLAVINGDYVLLRRSLDSTDTSTTAELARGAAVLLGTVRAERAADLTPAQVGALARVKPAPLRGLQPAATSGVVRGASITGTVLVFIMLTQYLSWTLIGVMQEKSNRVVEVLLAAVRPRQLLTGKLLGIAVVVFGQAALIAAVALGVAEAVGSSALNGATPLAVASQLLWLFLGYAFYSWLYAAAGSLVERQDQVQSLAIPLAVPLVFGYVVALSSAGSGHASTLLHVLAYLPPTAPFAMPILVALNAVTWWQFIGSVLLSIAATVGAARLAAAIYRRAILRTGRRVRFRELLHPPS